MPNVMAALTSSNAAKTRNPLKFTGVPQTRQQISAAGGPKFTVLSGQVEEALLFNKFFLIVDTCISRFGSVLKPKPKPQFSVKTELKPKPRFRWES